MYRAEPFKAEEPFRFFTQLHLQELTGLKATNIKELLDHVKTAPGSVIYHHTHHYLQQHQFLSPEPPNDFAYWITEVLNEVKLGEKIASINTHEFMTIRTLRDKISETLEDFLSKTKKPLKEAPEEQVLYLMKSKSFILPTAYEASSLEEFASVLGKVTIYSIYFHMFEARLRLEKPTNDFSLWFETALGEKELAKKFERLDPYTYTGEGLRRKMIKLIEAKVGKK